MPDIRNDDAMAELYAKDAGFAAQVLNDVLENGEPGELLIALRQMTKAFGGVQAVAEKAELNSTQLYRTLSAEGNPTLNSLRAVLKAMGLQLRVERVKGGVVAGETASPEAAVAES
jgi:probable addiction module antidote protein